MTIIRHALQVAGCIATLLLIACSESPQEQNEPPPQDDAVASGSVLGGHTTADCIADEDCTRSVLSRIETRMGGLEYTAGFPTRETVERIYDEMDYQRAVLAHQISDNLVSYYSMHVGPQEAIEGARMGDLVVWENFLDPKGIVLTGNDTTVYGMVYLDLKNNGPMVVEVPPSPFLGSVLDLWQVPLAGIDANGAKFVVVAEDYEGDVDIPDGFTELRSRTSLAVFFARGLVVEGDVEGAADTVFNSKVYPLSQIDNPPEMRIQLATGVIMDTISPMEPMVYWGRVAKVLEYVNPEIDQDASLMISLLKPLGIEPGQPFEPDERQQQILADAAHFGWVMAEAISYAPRFDDITYWSGTQWEWVLELDPSLREAFWTDLEARTNYYFQASMAQPAMKIKAIGKGSQYVRSARDSNGEWLDGGNLYRLNVPADPPAELFWSITLHDFETRSQVQTDSNNAALSSYDDLRYNDDGSVDLYFGPDAPEGFENNWVETVPGRGWWVWFRFYSPAEAFFDKSWTLPDFKKVQ